MNKGKHDINGQEDGLCRWSSNHTDKTRRESEMSLRQSAMHWPQQTLAGGKDGGAQKPRAVTEHKGMDALGRTGGGEYRRSGVDGQGGCKRRNA